MKNLTLGAMALLTAMTLLAACGAPLYKGGTAALETPLVEGSPDGKEGL